MPHCLQALTATPFRRTPWDNEILQRDPPGKHFYDDGRHAQKQRAHPREVVAYVLGFPDAQSQLRDVTVSDAELLRQLTRVKSPPLRFFDQPPKQRTFFRGIECFSPFFRRTKYFRRTHLLGIPLCCICT